MLLFVEAPEFPRPLGPPPPPPPFGSVQRPSAVRPSLFHHHSLSLHGQAEHCKQQRLTLRLSHLVNDGVEETPPSLSPVDDSSSAQEQLFVDLARAGANVGFKRWHPVPVTHLGGRLAGQAGMGGAWEWTSSPLRRHEGFAPMALYPAYTADFFDGKHNVVLGGSWATHPRIAGRRSFVNWYQRNYPYAWVGARVVRDVQ